MTTRTNQTASFADHLQRTVDIVFEVEVDASEGTISTDLGGVASFDTAADGTLDLDLSGLGEVEKVLELTVAADTGTVTATSAISSKDLTVSLDSNQDLTSQDVTFTVRLAAKREL